MHTSEHDEERGAHRRVPVFVAEPQAFLEQRDRFLVLRGQPQQTGQIVHHDEDDRPLPGFPETRQAFPVQALGRAEVAQIRVRAAEVRSDHRGETLIAFAVRDR